MFAPLRIQEEWDNSGLLIGSAEDEVHGVLVGFDCTPELIDEAVHRIHYLWMVVLVGVVYVYMCATHTPTREKM